MQKSVVAASDGVISFDFPRVSNAFSFVLFYRCGVAGAGGVDFDLWP